MNKIEAQMLIREAKHSTALLLSAMGTSFPAVAHLFVKWPDVVDAYIAEDEKRFYEDVYLLILSPVKILAESYAERAGSKEIVKEIRETRYPVTIETKNHLIRICNTQIHKIKLAPADHQGLEYREMNIPYVEECKHGKANS